VVGVTDKIATEALLQVRPIVAICRRRRRRRRRRRLGDNDAVGFFSVGDQGNSSSSSSRYAATFLNDLIDIAHAASFSLRFTAPLLVAEYFWLLAPRRETACHQRLYVDTVPGHLTHSTQYVSVY